MKKLLLMAGLATVLAACQFPKTDQMIAENELLRREIDARFNEVKAFDNYVLGLKREFAAMKTRHRIADAQLIPAGERDLSYTLLQDIRLVDEWLMALGKQVTDLKYDIGLSENRLAHKQQELENALVQMEKQRNQIKSAQNNLKILAGMMNRLDEQLCLMEYRTDSLNNELNKVYFAFGNKQELQENGLVKAAKGVPKRKKVVALRNDFNPQYFTLADKRTLKAIPIACVDAALLSSHPEGSYRLEGQGMVEQLVITDPDLFWRNTAYLAVLVQ